MKLKSFLSGILLLAANSIIAQKAIELKTGDIIFQTTKSRAAMAIELATHSKFSHVGMILKDKGQLYVLEAIDPVSITPFDEFVSRGEKKYYEVKRLKDATAEITPAQAQALIEKGKTLKGIHYDYAFNWDDQELYCSELVYKLYRDIVKLQLAQPRPLKTFDLSALMVKEQLKVKWGEKIPYNELMISPQQIYESLLLERVN